LPTGTYNISIVENGKVKSNVTIETAGKRARVDFDLKPSAGKAVMHYVLVKREIGSHIAPYWVEADANGTPIASTLNAQTRSPELAQDMYRHQTNTGLGR
jgi:hypothetical protein